MCKIRAFIKDRHWRERSFQFAYGLTRNIEDAKDVVADSFAQALAASDRFDQSKPAPNFMFRVIRNKFLDSRRRACNRLNDSLDKPVKAEGGATFAQFFPDKALGPAAQFAANDEARLVNEALAAVEPEHRNLLVMRGMYGISYAEMSQILGVGIGTVRSRLNRGKKLLAEALENY